MDQEQKLTKEVSEYAELAKQNKNVDVGLLMMNALQNANTKNSEHKSRKWAYTISAGLPPFGLLYAAKWYMSDDDSDKQAAKICVLLTVISLMIFWFLGKAIFSTSGASISEIGQTKPQDIYQLTQ